MFSMTDAISWAILEHYSPNLTNKVHTNVDPIMRHAVNQTLVGEHLYGFGKRLYGKYRNQFLCRSIGAASQYLCNRDIDNNIVDHAIM